MSGHRIQRPPCMTEDDSHALGSRGFWWVKCEQDGQFIDFERPRASEPLDIVLHRSRYTIGAGGPEHYRETLDLLAPPGEVPCASMGCDGRVPFAVEVELARYDDGEPPPRARLCQHCAMGVAP